jgi:hypothetical protein
MVVVVVPWTLPTYTQNQLPSRPNLSTHTLLKTVNANTLVMELSVQEATQMFQLMIPLHSCKHSNTDQSQSQLKLINQLSNPTVVEFSMLIVELPSIMESSLLDTSQELNPTGSSRTHGVQVGDHMVATSTLLTRLDKVSVVSIWDQSGQLPTEFDHQNHSFRSMFKF